MKKAFLFLLIGAATLLPAQYQVRGPSGTVSVSSPTVSVSASDVADNAGVRLPSARLCFTQVNANLVPTGSRVGSEQVVPIEKCGTVSSGTLVAGWTLAPTPVGSGLYTHIYVRPMNGNTVLLDYGIANISGTSWTLDNFDPTLVPVPATTLGMGVVTYAASGSGPSCSLSGAAPGPYALNCNLPFSTGAYTGVWTASHSYHAGDQYFYNGNIYAVNTAYTSGTTYGSVDTANTGQVNQSSVTTFNGGTVANPIVLPADPTLPLQAATKQYVDASAGTQQSAVNTVASGLAAEVTRATTTENTVAANATTAVGAETTRAELAETNLGASMSTFGTALTTETNRAELAEGNVLTAASAAQSTANQALTLAESGTGGGGGTTTVASVIEVDNLSVANTVAATRPASGTTGSTPSKKALTNCGTGWDATNSLLKPDYESGGVWKTRGGHRYCDAGSQSAAEAAGGPSYGIVTLTQTGSGSIIPANGIGAGQSNAPVTAISDYGLTTYDSLCSNSLLTVNTGIPGINIPACGTGITAELSETEDATYSDGSMLYPTNWTTTLADSATAWFRTGMFLMPANTNRVEFDINKSNSNGSYDGPGTSIDVNAGSVDFLPQANEFIGHGTCAATGTWCASKLNLQAGSTAMTGCPGGSTSCVFTPGHFYAFAEGGHMTGTQVTEYESQDGNTIPRDVYQWDQIWFADCGTAGTSCPSDYSRYSMIDPLTGNPPQGYDVQNGWSQGFDTQWQLYPTAVSSTTTLYVINDVIQWYKTVAGTGSTSYKSAPANLGDFEADGSSMLTNLDATSGDTTTLSCTGVSVDTSWYVTAPNSLEFNAVGDKCTATLPTYESTLSTRVYWGGKTLSTSATGATQMLNWNSGSNMVLEIYANDGSNNLTLQLPATTTSAALACTLTTTSSGQATTPGGKDYIDITWEAGTSSTTGLVTALFDGVAPTAANCNWLNTGINTSVFSFGTVTGVNNVVFGYLTDSGTNATWDFDMDMVGFSSLASPLGAAIPVTTTTGGTGTYLTPANNLSDVSSAATARANLGLGTAATQNTSAFDPAGAATTAQATAENYAAALLGSYTPVYASGAAGNLGEYDFSSGTLNSVGTYTGALATSTSSPSMDLSVVYQPGYDSVLTTAASQFYTATLPSNATTLYARFNLWDFTTLPETTSARLLDLWQGTTVEMFELYEASNGQLTALVTPAGSSGTSLSCGLIPRNAWTRIELYWVGSATVGQFVVKINGTVSSTCNTTATLNTLGTSGLYINTAKFGQVSSASVGWTQDISMVGFSSTGYLGNVTFTTGSTTTAHQTVASLVCADASGSGTAQSCTTTPTFTPQANDCVVYTTTTGNAGAGLTLNVNSLGAVSVAKWMGHTTLVAGDVAANSPVLACYNGTVWNLSTIGNGPSASTGATLLASQQFTGQTANLATTYIPSFTIPSTGWYEVCAELGESTAATTSSTGPSAIAVYTSGFDSAIKNEQMGAGENSTGNSTTVAGGACDRKYLLSGSQVGIKTGGYVSTGGTPMAYYLAERVYSSN